MELSEVAKESIATIDAQRKAREIVRAYDSGEGHLLGADALEYDAKVAHSIASIIVNKLRQEKEPA